MNENKIDFEKQEHLSLKEIEKYNAPLSVNIGGDRPPANFIDLMNWTTNNFVQYLKDREITNLLVNNRIVIDGQFSYYCKLNDIEIKCLWNDSIISWKTDNNYEKYFVQGVFLIKSKDIEFIHAALFHKGNQNEDEISFFIIVSNNNYEKYVALRNDFDNWVQQRDRSNLHVRVFEGEDIPYTKDLTWNDLFLPENEKKEIKSLVENFLSSKDFYLKNNIPWKRGFLLYGGVGLGKTSIIKTIMSVYNFKPITVLPSSDDETISAAFSYAEEQSPSLLYFEDLDSLLEKNVDLSLFLNLIDGVSSKNGLLIIATANDVTKLKKSITDRPSRFDRKFEIKLPDKNMSYLYLKKWFKSMITDKKCKELSTAVVKQKFSYAYIKELYISVMFEALSNNRKVPIEKDITVSLNRLIKDKNLLNNNSISMSKYFDKG